MARLTVVYMRTSSDPKKSLHRILTKPLPYFKYDGTMGEIETGFDSDGSSVPEWLRGIFPRHRHPVAFFRHDKRCREAKSATERKRADNQFRTDVRKTSWWITAAIGYCGARIGALFGVGVNYHAK